MWDSVLKLVILSAASVVFTKNIANADSWTICNGPEFHEPLKMSFLILKTDLTSPDPSVTPFYQLRVLLNSDRPVSTTLINSGRAIPEFSNRNLGRPEKQPTGDWITRTDNKSFRLILGGALAGPQILVDGRSFEIRECTKIDSEDLDLKAMTDLYRVATEPPSFYPLPWQCALRSVQASAPVKVALKCLEPGDGVSGIFTKISCGFRQKSAEVAVAGLTSPLSIGVVNYCAKILKLREMEVKNPAINTTVRTKTVINDDVIDAGVDRDQRASPGR